MSRVMREMAIAIQHIFAGRGFDNQHLYWALHASMPHQSKWRLAETVVCVSSGEK